MDRLTDARTAYSQPVWPRLHVGRGVHLGGVSVFPLWSDAPRVPSIDWGARIRIAECPGPSVDSLRVDYDGRRPTVLVAGEIFEGGWQHRALVQDVLLTPGTGLEVPVACVEQGRWVGSAGHRRGLRQISPSVRAAQSLSNGPSRQQRVWEAVGSIDGLVGRSATTSLLASLDVIVDADEASSLRASAHPLAGQRGVLVGLGGLPVVLELFGSSAGLARHLDTVLDACLLDSRMLTPRRTPAHLARRFVSDVEAGRLRHRLVPWGDGTSVMAHGPGFAVRGLGWQQHLLHATVLNTEHQLAAVG